MTDALRSAAMEECLAVSKAAMVIFDAVEAGHITMDAATALVSMNAAVDAIRVAMAAMILSGSL